jgi:putative endonuclease
MKNYYVYILASQKNGTLYIGITSNLARRIHEHQHSLVPGFTQKYHTHLLVHVEVFSAINQAILREKKLKNWHRPWKLALIEKYNSAWEDLAKDLIIL